MEGPVVFIAIFLLDGAAAILAAGGCRLARKFHRRPGWYLGILAAIAPVAFMFLFPDGGFLFHPDRFQHSKTSPAVELKAFLFSVGIALIPPLLVVRHYRRGFEKISKA